MTAAEPITIYESVVTQVGPQVPAFIDHGILIFFADHAPAELHDIAVLHKVKIAADGPQPGDWIEFGGGPIEILAVGHVVRDNLLNLGHLDLKADGRTEPELPGDVCVEKRTVPLPGVGDIFRIVRDQSVQAAEEATR